MVPKSLLDNSSGKLRNFGGRFNRERWTEGRKNWCLSKTRGEPPSHAHPLEPHRRGSAAHRGGRVGSRGGERIWGLLSAAGSG